MGGTYGIQRVLDIKDYGNATANSHGRNIEHCLSYKLLRSLVQRAIRSSKRRFVDEKLNCEQDTRSWWETVRQITNNQTQSSRVCSNQWRETGQQAAV